jgi:uncharacterized protein (DUF885 family)
MTRFVAACSALLVIACSPGADPARDAATLAQLLDHAHERMIANSVQLQFKYERPIERLPDLSLAHLDREAATARAILDTLATIDRASLPESDQVSADALEWFLTGVVAAPQYHFLSLASITPYQSPLTNELLFLGRDMPLGTTDERARYLARLSEVPALADTIRAGLVARAERGIRIPKPEIQQIVGALASLTAPGAASPYAPSKARIDALPDSARDAFSTAVARIVDDRLNPAVTRLADYLNGDYLQAAPTEVGLRQYPGGEAYYRYRVALNTTLDLAPETIHQTGLDYMARLEGSMDSLLKVMGFSGTRAQFQASIAKDPRFRARTPEEVGARYQKYHEAIKPLTPKLFSREPKAPGEFRRLNPALEASQTYGFYQPPTPASPVGIYFYNASNLATRSLFTIPSIAYHELVPGHHVQITLADENPDLPKFRRDLYTTAHGEGWAEYATALAGELGLYADPYDYYARLIMEAFLTMRLVVDPGMNLLGWSRERAMDYMREHTMMAESEIVSESLRYSVDLPAQALGYKVGAMEFHRLRRSAQSALGASFDVRAFHALILDAGGLPMSVVGRMVDRWVASQRR